MAQFGKLTKYQILDILAKFEERLPNMGKTFFEPSWNFNPHDPLSINVEARRMVHFLGLTDYMPEVHFENLPPSMAANVNMSNSTVSKKIHINVDYDTLYNNEHALRALAHEVCHKYLQIYGLYTEVLEAEDEARAELCTIYSGFGLVTLKGYSEGSGYVNIDDFCQTFSLVYKTRGMSDSEILSITPEAYLPNMKQALSTEYINLTKAVLNSQKGDARFRRNIMLLEFALHNIKDIKERHESQDSFLRKNIYRDDAEKYPFYNLMKPELILSKSMESRELDGWNQNIEELLHIFLSHLNVSLEELNNITTTEIVCPCCGFKKSKTMPAEITVTRCPKCKHYFAWDATQWSPETKQDACEERSQSLWNKFLRAIGIK